MTNTTDATGKVKEIVIKCYEYNVNEWHIMEEFFDKWVQTDEAKSLIGELGGDEKETKITTEALYADKWVRKTDDTVFPIEKKIGNRNPLNASDDTNIELVVHGMYNSSQFAIQFPDGGLLNFNPRSMEDLKAFERMISFYDAPF